ncbi:hypothetical protein BU14_2581s0001 [Porphyra umbilicalis]|uniref:Uncharacterized protein n=1 Tax=Porphyra umbilicalis TaxID=2786 RepID=A0A1X6NIX1_PORUM|nr:hypothetical protein BU14_2581s0001 [Porphyra umbilicalis]|eukprot:OSX68559.1 hypothetical protein BU14_2581s0001 [Porphyra umbilicalis]
MDATTGPPYLRVRVVGRPDAADASKKVVAAATGRGAVAAPKSTTAAAAAAAAVTVAVARRAPQPRLPAQRRCRRPQLQGVEPILAAPTSSRRDLGEGEGEGHARRDEGRRRGVGGERGRPQPL